MEEKIICRICGTELSISKATPCPTCREVVKTKSELMQEIKEKSIKSETLQAEIAAARTELWMRSRRAQEYYIWERPQPNIGKEEFFHGVRNTPRKFSTGQSQGEVRQGRITQAEIDAFE